MAARKAQFTRDEIVETAFKMVQEGGWDGLSVPMLAKKINSSTMPIYSHFKNVKELSDAVYEKAVESLLSYMTTVVTGDKWLDHAIGYVHFAAEEEQLFRCLFDGRNPELQYASLQKWTALLAEQLSDYPLFADLSDEQIHTIRHARFMLIHGYASGVNNGWHPQKNDADVEHFLRKTTRALYDGLMAQFEAEKHK